MSIARFKIMFHEWLDSTSAKQVEHLRMSQMGIILLSMQ